MQKVPQMKRVRSILPNHRGLTFLVEDPAKVKAVGEELYMQAYRMKDKGADPAGYYNIKFFRELP